MTPGEKREETIYRCPDCDGILVITDLAEGVLRALPCKRCNRRHTVYLGGRKAAAERPASPDPRTPPAAPSVPRPASTPPIETRRIRDMRG